jgi:hypothetical protein
MLGLPACSAARPGGLGTGDGGSAGSAATSGAGGGTSAGPTGSASSGSGAGGGPADAGPDVKFDWPETPPGAKCLAGKYAGMFNGVYMSSLTFFPAPIPVAGNVNITLGQTMNGEFFNITDGKLDGVADGAFPFAGTIVGGLDCKTLQFTGQIKMGSYAVPGWMVVGFEGDMPSGYDKVAHTFTNGKWTVHEANQTFGGSGTWTATWTGP